MHNLTYPESYQRLLDYLDSENDLEYRLRMGHDWDDDNYEQLIALMLQVISDFKPLQLMPMAVLSFFTSGITRLTGIIGNPAFTDRRDKHGAALAAYRELVNQRKAELLALQQKLMSGELFQ